MKKEVETLNKLASKLFSLMSVDATPEVLFDKENDAFVVNVDAGDATGLLIGKKGETLSSIQNVLGVLFKQEIGEWRRIILNVGDYREKEEGYLRNLAATTAQRAIETREPQHLYNLKPWQRRVIHLALSEEKGIETASEGEGEERYLVIKPKK